MTAPISDHAAQAAARLLEQYRSKPLLAGLVTDLAAGLQLAEDTAWDVLASRSMDAARGDTLDRLGELVGFARLGLDDETYRAVLRGVIAENNSDATGATAVGILRALFQPQGGVFAHGSLQGASVGYVLMDPALSPALFSLMRGVFLRSLAGGVQLAFLGVASSPAFAMAGPQAWVGGFGSIAPVSVMGGVVGRFATSM